MPPRRRTDVLSATRCGALPDGAAERGGRRRCYRAAFDSTLSSGGWGDGGERGSRRPRRSAQRPPQQAPTARRGAGAPLHSVYSRDMGRGNSREGGGAGVPLHSVLYRPGSRLLQEPPPFPVLTGHDSSPPRTNGTRRGGRARAAGWTVGGSGGLGRGGFEGGGSLGAGRTSTAGGAPPAARLSSCGRELRTKSACSSANTCAGSALSAPCQRPWIWRHRGGARRVRAESLCGACVRAPASLSLPPPPPAY